MSWITLTTADLDDTKVAALLEALRSSALGTGQDDPVEEIIASVTARIRAEIQGCSRNQVDSDTTKIPASLKRLGCRMVVFDLMSRLQQDLTEDERSERKSDLRYLERIAACEVPIETPDNATAPDVQSGVRIAQVGTTNRRASRQTLSGL